MRRSGWRWGALGTFGLAGLLFVTTAETAGDDDLRSAPRVELADLIHEQEDRYEQGLERVQELQDEVDALTAAQVGDRRVAEARAAVEQREPSAGLTAVTGPGVSVALDDAPRPPEGQEIPGDPRPDDLVVHQQDVQAVVNALWAGGAEAMQIMDQRVISTSAVRCVGNTLILQGRVYSPPFTITAVGDVEGMRAALAASPEIDIYQQYVEAYGLGYDVRVHEQVTLPPYRGPLDLEYAQPGPR